MRFSTKAKIIAAVLSGMSVSAFSQEESVRLGSLSGDTMVYAGNLTNRISSADWSSELAENGVEVDGTTYKLVPSFGDGTNETFTVNNLTVTGNISFGNGVNIVDPPSTPDVPEPTDSETNGVNSASILSRTAVARSVEVPIALETDNPAQFASITLGSRAPGCEIGTNSFVQGTYCGASGTYSFANGQLSYAYGDFSTAKGYDAEAYGFGSYARGLHVSARGEFSTSEGSGCSSTGSVSHAEGYGTKAYGDISHSEGVESTASGAASHAEGYRTESSGHYSHSEGVLSRASGEGSHAEGYKSVASGKYSKAVGVMACATNDNSFVWSSGNSGQYYSNGKGTFNINPARGFSGVYVGNDNLFDFVDSMSSRLIDLSDYEVVRPLTTNELEILREVSPFVTNGVMECRFEEDYIGKGHYILYIDGVSCATLGVSGTDVFYVNGISYLPFAKDEVLFKRKNIAFSMHGLADPGYRIPSTYTLEDYALYDELETYAGDLYERINSVENNYVSKNGLSGLETDPVFNGWKNGTINTNKLVFEKDITNFVVGGNVPDFETDPTFSTWKDNNVGTNEVITAPKLETALKDYRTILNATFANIVVTNGNAAVSLLDEDGRQLSVLQDQLVFKTHFTNEASRYNVFWPTNAGRLALVGDIPTDQYIKDLVDPELYSACGYTNRDDGAIEFFDNIGVYDVTAPLTSNSYVFGIDTKELADRLADGKAFTAKVRITIPETGHQISFITQNNSIGTTTTKTRWKHAPSSTSSADEVIEIDIVVTPSTNFVYGIVTADVVWQGSYTY